MRSGFCALLLAAGVANAGPPPPGADEEVVQTKDGCGIVIPRDTPKAQRDGWSELAWGGACIGGLATGMSILHPGMTFDDASFGPIAGWVWHGRPFGETELHWSNGASSKHFTWNGRSVSWNTLDATTATWSKGLGMSSSVGDGETKVQAYLGANGEKQVFVYHPRAKTSEFIPCPADGASCDAVWSQHAAPVIRNIKAFLTENQPKARARRAETDQLVARWKQQVGTQGVTRREDEAIRMNAAAVEERAAKKAAEQACTDAETTARNAYYAELITPDRKAAYAATLKQIYGEQCPKHWNAENGLKEAETLRAEAEQDRVRAAEEARNAQLEGQRQKEAERQAKSAERRQFWGSLLGAVGTAAQVYQQTVNAASQQQAAQDEAQALAASSLAAYSEQSQPAPTQSQAAPQPAYSQPPTISYEQQERESAEANAISCLTLVPDHQTNTGGFINKCGYGVNYAYCTTGSTDAGLGEVSSAFACSKGGGFGSSHVRANSRQTAGTKGAANVYVAACRDPYEPRDTQFVGNGIRFACRK